MCDDLKLFNERKVVPRGGRCWAKVAMSVWWPGVSRDVQQMVQNCRMCKTKCDKERASNSYTAADYLWQLVGTDLFEMNQKTLTIVSRLYLTVP